MRPDIDEFIVDVEQGAGREGIGAADLAIACLDVDVVASPGREVIPGLEGVGGCFLDGFSGCFHRVSDGGAALAESRHCQCCRAAYLVRCVVYQWWSADI